MSECYVKRQEVPLPEKSSSDRILELLKEMVVPLLKSLQEATSNPQKGYFTISEAAAFIGCSDKHLYRHVVGGTLPVSNIGTNDGPDYPISLADLTAWMEKRKAGALPPPRRKKKKELVPEPLPFSPHRHASKNAV